MRSDDKIGAEFWPWESCKETCAAKISKLLNISTQNKKRKIAFKESEKHFVDEKQKKIVFNKLVGPASIGSAARSTRDVLGLKILAALST